MDVQLEDWVLDNLLLSIVIGCSGIVFWVTLVVTACCLCVRRQTCCRCRSRKKKSPNVIEIPEPEILADAEVPTCNPSQESELMPEELPYCRYSPAALAFMRPKPQEERLDGLFDKISRNQQILTRKAILSAKLSFEKELLAQKRLFFSLIMKGSLDLRMRSKATLTQEMQQSGIKTMGQLMSFKGFEEILASDKLRLDAAIYDEGYDYLFRMDLLSLTSERVEAMQQLHNTKMLELLEIEGKTLDELSEAALLRIAQMEEHLEISPCRSTTRSTSTSVQTSPELEEENVSPSPGEDAADTSGASGNLTLQESPELSDVMIAHERDQEESVPFRREFAHGASAAHGLASELETVEADLPDELEADLPNELEASVTADVDLVAPVCQCFEVCSPNGQEACSGIYQVVPGRLANGLPIWKSENSELWLYSAHTGRWCIGGDDVEKDDFNRASGFLLQTSPNDGMLPQHVRSVWQRWDPNSSCFFKDADISVQPHGGWHVLSQMSPRL